MIDDKQFAELIHNLLLSGLEPRELGDRLSVSRPTILRWHCGRSAPYEPMRRVVAEWAQREFNIKVGQ